MGARKNSKDSQQAAAKIKFFQIIKRKQFYFGFKVSVFAFALFYLDSPMMNWV